MLRCIEVSQPAGGMGHSLPMRSGPVSQHVGNGLKADVPGKWRNGKTVTVLARRRRGAHFPFCAGDAPVLGLPFDGNKVKNLRAITRHYSATFSP